MNQSVLVTGGAGFIGSHACKALSEAGYTPVTYDNLARGSRDSVLWGPFEHGDVLDRTRLDQIIETYKPIAVMHFAAFAYVGESVREPGRYYRNNVAGTLNLLGALRDHNIAHMIFSSSCAVYGSPERLPIDEKTPTQPVNPYGWTKLIAEQMIRDFDCAHGLNWIALRYFNAAGADPDGEIGESLGLEPRVIPRAIAALTGEVEPLQIFGNDYDTPDGTCIRDYVHVSDIAAAHVLALQHIVDGKPSQVLNLGTGYGRSIGEVISAVEEISGRQVPLAFAPRRPGDPPRLVANAQCAQEVLGWRPQLSDLAVIVRTALAWRDKQRNTHS